MKRALVDLFDRAGATFAQSFLASITVGTATGAGALKLAAVAGAYALGKFLLVKANAYLATPPQTEVVAVNPRNYTQIVRVPEPVAPTPAGAPVQAAP